MEETIVNGRTITRLEASVWEALSLLDRDQVAAVAKLTNLCEHDTLMALSGLLARGMIQRCGDHEHIQFVLYQHVAAFSSDFGTPQPEGQGAV